MLSCGFAISFIKVCASLSLLRVNKGDYTLSLVGGSDELDIAVMMEKCPRFREWVLMLERALQNGRFDH